MGSWDRLKSLQSPYDTPGPRVPRHSTHQHSSLANIPAEAQKSATQARPPDCQRLPLLPMFRIRLSRTLLKLSLRHGPQHQPPNWPPCPDDDVLAGPGCSRTMETAGMRSPRVYSAVSNSHKIQSYDTRGGTIPPSWQLLVSRFIAAPAGGPVVASSPTTSSTTN